MHNSAPTVLVADDNADMRYYLASLLKEKYNVRTAANGLDALHKVREHHPDVVLTDIMMPIMNGFELLRQIRTGPVFNDLPVIMLSARAGEEARIEGVEAGANDYLVKPFAAKELIARVAAHVEISRMRKRAEAARETERNRLYSLFMQAPALIAVLRGPDLVFELANPIYLEVAGKSASIIGKPILEAIPEIKDQPIAGILFNVYRTGVEYKGNEVRVRINRNDSGVLTDCYFNFIYQPVKNESGDTDGILVHAVDVTELVRTRKIIESQNGVLEIIASSASLSAGLQTLIDSIESLSSSDMKASILLYDETRKCLLHGAAPRLPEAYNNAIHGIAIGPEVGSCGTAAYLRKPVVVEDVSKDPKWAKFKDVAMASGLRACWSTPIILNEKLLGTFAVYHTSPYLPTPDDQLIIEFATRTAALAMDKFSYAKSGQE